MAKMVKATERTFDDEPVSVQLRIPGLHQTGDDTFVFHGLRVREIDWGAVAAGLGYEHIPDALAAEIDRAAFRYSVAEALADRMERVG